MDTTKMSLHAAVNNMGKRLTFQLIIALRIAVSVLHHVSFNEKRLQMWKELP